MLVLLAALPYIGAIAMYWLTTKDLIQDAQGEVPSNWSWRLVAPVMVGGLTPLALAARDGVSGTDRAWLLSTTGLAIVFTVVLMGALNSGEKFFRLQRPVSFGGKKFNRAPRWRLIVATGTLLLCYGATVNVIVASA